MSSDNNNYRKKAWLVEIENSFCQTQDCWFVTETDATQAATWLKETTSYTVRDPFLCTLPDISVMTFEEFLNKHNKH
jgi:hypothetical protein